MFKKILIAVACLMCWGVTEVYAAGSDATHSTVKVAGTDIYETTVSFTADDATAAIPTETISNVDGWILLVAVNHGGTACAAGFDVTFVDEDGVDAAGGSFVDLDAGTNDTYQAAPTLGSAYGARFVVGDIVVTFASCGTNSATGEIYIYWTR